MYESMAFEKIRDSQSNYLHLALETQVGWRWLKFSKMRSFLEKDRIEQEKEMEVVSSEE